MKLYIGVDLGTSAVKLLLMDAEGGIKNVVSKEYPLEFPQPGWSQQAPEDWRKAVMEGIPELLQGFDGADVAGIGCGGQMHGLVVLDENDNVIRPAILWNDGRTAAQVDYLNGVIGKEKLSALTANIAFAGFTAPKILWMRDEEPENYAKIAKIMLPKDYVNYILTGVHACDYSDASGMLLLDVEHKCWSKEMLEICGITEAQMPKLFESYDCIGTVKPEMPARATAIKTGALTILASTADCPTTRPPTIESACPTLCGIRSPDSLRISKAKSKIIHSISGENGTPALDDATKTANLAGRSELLKIITER